MVSTTASPYSSTANLQHTGRSDAWSTSRNTPLAQTQQHQWGGSSSGSLLQPSTPTTAVPSPLASRYHSTYSPFSSPVGAGGGSRRGVRMYCFSLFSSPPHTHTPAHLLASVHTPSFSLLFPARSCLCVVDDQLLAAGSSTAGQWEEEEDSEEEPSSILGTSEACVEEEEDDEVEGEEEEELVLTDAEEVTDAGAFSDHSVVTPLTGICLPGTVVLFPAFQDLASQDDALVQQALRGSYGLQALECVQGVSFSFSPVVPFFLFLSSSAESFAFSLLQPPRVSLPCPCFFHQTSRRSIPPASSSPPFT